LQTPGLFILTFQLFNPNLYIHPKISENPNIKTKNRHIEQGFLD